MKTTLFIMYLITSLTSGAQAIADTLCCKGHFPEKWDINRDLRGTNLNSKVLAWTHKKNDEPFEWKICIKVTVSKDSTGKTIYYISEKYTNEKPFDQWHTGSIHYGPAEGQIFGFHDLHIEVFDHKPSKAELLKLINHWEFKLWDTNYQTVECGIDEQLWFDIFGFIPNPDFTLK